MFYTKASLIYRIINLKASGFGILEARDRICGPAFGNFHRVLESELFGCRGVGADDCGGTGNPHFQARALHAFARSSSLFVACR